MHHLRVCSAGISSRCVPGEVWRVCYCSSVRFSSFCNSFLLSLNISAAVWWTLPDLPVTGLPTNYAGTWHIYGTHSKNVNILPMYYTYGYRRIMPTATGLLWLPIQAYRGYSYGRDRRTMGVLQGASQPLITTVAIAKGKSDDGWKNGLSDASVAKPFLPTVSSCAMTLSSKFGYARLFRL